MFKHYVHNLTFPQILKVSESVFPHNWLAAVWRKVLFTEYWWMILTDEAALQRVMRQRRHGAYCMFLHTLPDSRTAAARFSGDPGPSSRHILPAAPQGVL